MDKRSEGTGSFCSTVNSLVASDSILKQQMDFDIKSNSSDEHSRKGPFTLPSQNEPSKHVSEQQTWEKNQIENSDFTDLVMSLSLEAVKELSDRPKIGVIHNEAIIFSKSIGERLEHLSKIETDLSIDEAIEIVDAASLLKVINRLEDNVKKAGQVAHTGALLILQADIMAEKGHELLARSKRMLQLASFRSNLNTFSTMESSSD